VHRRVAGQGLGQLNYILDLQGGAEGAEVSLECVYMFGMQLDHIRLDSCRGVGWGQGAQDHPRYSLGSFGVFMIGRLSYFCKSKSRR
jgi:hypothetical protein